MNKDQYKGISFSSSILDFDKYIVCSSDNKEQIFSIIRDCQVSNHKIRCDVWRLSLGIINIDSTWEQKVEQLGKQRERYNALVNKHTRTEQPQQNLNQSPKLDPKLANNPLGRLLVPKPVVVASKQTSDDDFLREEVRKDAERTYQEKQFFTNPAIIKILSKVLFVWSKQFPDVSYIQGMNEVIASIIWVYFMATVDPNEKYKQYEGIVEDLIKKYIFFHSNEYAEADIYSIFDKMMNSGHKLMFKSEHQTNKQLNPNSKNNSPILQRILKLTDIKFKMVDEKLFKHIKLNEVGMRSFLLRWIRCIHTREFELEESFVIWDNIFLAYYLDPSQGLYFIDCTTLAMLMYLRDIALKKDVSFEILQLYQKYPKIQGKHLQELMELAWNVKDSLEISQKQADNKKQLTQFRTTYQPIQPEKSTPIKSNQSKASSLTNIKPIITKTSADLSETGHNKQVQIKKPEPPKVQVIKKPQPKIQEIKKQQPKIEVKKEQPKVQIIKKQQQPKVEIIKKPEPPKPIVKPPPSVKQYSFDITFNFDQWKQVEQLMKKSIEQNRDLQSRSLTMKVMKIFSRKEQQEIKKIEAFNNNEQ